MEQIQIKETTSQSIKVKKYKKALNQKLLLKSIKIGILFALVMIALRFAVLWIISIDSPLSLSEVYKQRFYLGSEKVSVFKHMDYTIPYKTGILNLSLNSGMWLVDFLVNTLIFLVIQLPFGIVMWILSPFISLFMKLISCIDIIIPQNGSILLWWFVYMSIIGVVGSYLVNSKVKRKVPESIEEVNQRIANVKSTSSIVVLMMILGIVALLGTKTMTQKFLKDDTQYYNIKKLIDYQIVNTTTNSNEFQNYEEIVSYAKGKNNTFTTILNNSGLNTTTIPNGMMSVNTDTKYEKYTKSYRIETIYKVQPDFSKGSMQEGFYAYYEYPDLESVNQSYVQMFTSLINELTLVQVEDDFLSNEIINVLNTGKKFQKKYKEDQLQLTIGKGYVYLSYKNASKIYIPTKDELVVENGIITSPVRQYATVQDYKNGLKDRMNSLIGSYKLEDQIYINSKTTLVNSKFASGINKQFAESIMINYSDIYKSKNPSTSANNLYQLVSDYCKVDLGNKELFNEYVRSVNLNREINLKFKAADEFFEEYKIYDYPLITSPIINIDGVRIRILMPVIAEGKGYI